MDIEESCAYEWNMPSHYDKVARLCDFRTRCWWSMEEKNTAHTEVKSLGPRRNARHFPDDIFKCIFLNEIVAFW